jgi:hypothetical protein
MRGARGYPTRNLRAVSSVVWSMTKTTRLAATVAVAAAVSVPVTATAQAAAPWATPGAFGAPAHYVQQPVLAFGANGNGLAGWDTHTAPPTGVPPAPAGNVLRLTQGDGHGAVRTFPETLVAGPALGDDGRGLILRSALAAGGRKTNIMWSNVDAAGAVGAPRPLVSAALAQAPTLAVDARGDALAGWAEVAPPRSKRQLWSTLTVKVAWKPAGARTFSKPQALFDSQVLAYDDPGHVVVALNAGGRALVAYGDAHETRHGTKTNMYAWTAARAGARFGTRLTAGPHDGVVETGAVVDARGRSTIVWGSQDGGEEANEPWVVRAASLVPGGKRFGAVQTLDSGGVNRPMGTIAVAADGAGRVLAAWSGVRRDPGVQGGFTFPVQTATLDPATGRFGAVQQLAPDGAVGGAAVRGQDGAAIVTWAHVVQYQLTDQALAAVRPAGATAFGTPEALAEPDDAQPPAVAFDPASGAPVAAWSARPGGHDPFYGLQQDAVLRIASRAAP